MNRYTHFILIILVMLRISSALEAAQIPRSGHFDRRVKSVIYNPKQVIKMVGHYGYSTHIELSPLEIVQNIAMGDADAWDVAPTGNHIFLKPKGKKAATNMTIITNKRVYHFDLYARYAKGSRYINSKKMYYQISFRYPEEEAHRHKKQVAAKKLQQAFTPQSHDTHDGIVPLNWDYWSKGSEQINPVKVFDDGRFTYLTFARQADMPAIYTIDHDDTESLMNTHINPHDPDTIIVQKVVHRMVLRHGNNLVLIVNQSYTPPNTHGTSHTTTMPMVERVIKGRP